MRSSGSSPSSSGDSSAATQAGRALDEHARRRCASGRGATSASDSRSFPTSPSAPSPAAVEERHAARHDARRARDRARHRPRRATAPPLDSVARIHRPDSTTASPSSSRSATRASSFPSSASVPLDEAQRLATVDERRAAHPPRHPRSPPRIRWPSGRESSGRCRVEQWQSYFTAASQRAKAADPRVKIGVLGLDLRNRGQSAVRVGGRAGLADRRRRILVLPGEERASTTS